MATQINLDYGTITCIDLYGMWLLIHALTSTAFYYKLNQIWFGAQGPVSI